MTTLSVILPVLNGASTISRALGSLLVQSYPDFEVLVVDDGSTDQTLGLVHELAQKDRRIKVITLSDTQGVGHARNAALAQAQGEWVVPLDADDWYAPDRLADLLEAATSLQADIVFDNMYIVDQGTGEVKGQTLFGDKNQPEKLSPRDLFERDTPFSSFATGYAKPFFRAAFLKENSIRYDERYALGEDFLFLAQAMLSGAQTYALPSVGYYYTHRLTPLFSRLETDAKPGRSYDQILAASTELVEKFHSKIEPDALCAARRRHRQFEALAHVRKIKDMIHSQHLKAAAQAILQRPSSLVFVVRMLFWRLQTAKDSKSRT
ncbi:MAG: glycosyltransferase family 2 protein [Bdellovibrionales bacterium]